MTIFTTDNEIVGGLLTAAVGLAGYIFRFKIADYIAPANGQDTYSAVVGVMATSGLIVLWGLAIAIKGIVSLL
jgi:hypothetical protein